MRLSPRRGNFSGWKTWLTGSVNTPKPAWVGGDAQEPGGPSGRLCKVGVGKARTAIRGIRAGRISDRGAAVIHPGRESQAPDAEELHRKRLAERGERRC